MIRWMSIWMCLAAMLLRGESASGTLAANGVAEFKAAYQAWDGARFSVAAELFRQASTNAPESCTNFYWLGVAQFHRMLQLQSLPASPANTVAADAAMEDALAALKTAVKLDERSAESHALLGTLYGMKIDGSLVRAAWFGPRVERHRNKALKWGGANPRVQYLLGMCEFHTAGTPAERHAALATLLAAEKLFEAEAQRLAGPLEPRWGRSSCLTFIGRTYELLGQGQEASGYYRKALAAHPADHLAAEGLGRVMEKK
jgi:tetratricopeptide (TPR) repeat protein